MSAWERMAKRIVKAIIWAIAIKLLCLYLVIEMSNGILAIALFAVLVDNILDIFLPTDKD